MIDRVLIGLDGSRGAEGALPHAVGLAEAYGAELVLLRVLEDAPTGAAPMDPVDWRMRHAEAEAYLNRAAARIAERGLPVEWMVAEGNAAEEIVNAAGRRDVDLVVVGSQGKSGAPSPGLCSTAQEVITGVGRSVLLVRYEDGPPSEDLSPISYRRLLVPVDGSRRAEWAACQATHLARSNSAELLLACVVPVPQTPMRPPLTPEDSELVERLVERGRRWAEEYVEELRNRLMAPDLRVRALVLVSPRVDETLCELPARYDADLVVVSAHGASGEARWPYGSVASRLLTHGSVPVLVFQDQAIPREQPVLAESAADDSRSVRLAG
ncbi:MAG TPA: universal stress protein [Thermoanaerobaculia bacterium]|nr:universal stress protein [Thermoanaerobaculia bacterium]